jgi:hypothetical protein
MDLMKGRAVASNWARLFLTPMVGESAMEIRSEKPTLVLKPFGKL